MNDLERAGRVPVTRAWLVSELSRIRGLLMEAREGMRGTDILDLGAAVGLLSEALLKAAGLPTPNEEDEPFRPVCE